MIEFGRLQAIFSIIPILRGKEFTIKVQKAETEINLEPISEGKGPATLTALGDFMEDLKSVLLERQC